MYEGSNFSTSLPTLIICLFNFGHRSGCERQLTVVLTWISLMTNNVEHWGVNLIATFLEVPVVEGSLKSKA